MKTLNLAVLVSAVTLLISGLASAETSSKNIQHQNFAKRPYHQPVENQKPSDFEGATLVKEDAPIGKDNVSKHKPLRINMLGQRPYVEDVR